MMPDYAIYDPNEPQLSFWKIAVLPFYSISQARKLKVYLRATGQEYRWQTYETQLLVSSVLLDVVRFVLLILGTISYLLLSKTA